MASGKRIGFELDVTANGMDFTISRRGDYLDGGFDDALGHLVRESHDALQRLKGRVMVHDVRLYLACRSCGYDNEGRALPKECKCSAI